MDLLIGTGIGIYCCKSAEKLKKEKPNFFVALWRSLLELQCSSGIREKRNFVRSSGRAAITKTWKKVLKSSHRVNITVNLKRIHQYLSPIKFL